MGPASDLARLAANLALFVALFSMADYVLVRRSLAPRMLAYYHTRPQQVASEETSVQLELLQLELELAHAGGHDVIILGDDAVRQASALAEIARRLKQSNSSLTCHYAGLPSLVTADLGIMRRPLLQSGVAAVVYLYDEAALRAPPDARLENLNHGFFTRAVMYFTCRYNRLITTWLGQMAGPAGEHPFAVPSSPVLAQPWVPHYLLPPPPQHTPPTLDNRPPHMLFQPVSHAERAQEDPPILGLRDFIQFASKHKIIVIVAPLPEPLAALQPGWESWDAAVQAVCQQQGGLFIRRRDMPADRSLLPAWLAQLLSSHDR